MVVWLIAAIERLPRRMCRVVVAVASVLLPAAAITALTLQARPGVGARPPKPTAPAPSHHTSETPLPRSARPPVSATELQRARGVAGRFLVTYLQFAYGRAGAGSVKAVTPDLRSQLITERARVTPAERRRRPRVVSLRVVGMTPGLVLATETIEDGGIAAFSLRFTPEEHDGRWSASSVREG